MPRNRTETPQRWPDVAKAKQCPVLQRWGTGGQGKEDQNGSNTDTAEFV